MIHDEYAVKSVEFSVVKRLIFRLLERIFTGWPVTLLNLALHKNESFDGSLNSAELEKNNLNNKRIDTYLMYRLLKSKVNASLKSKC